MLLGAALPLVALWLETPIDLSSSLGLRLLTHGLNFGYNLVLTPLMVIAAGTAYRSLTQTRPQSEVSP